MRCATTVAAMVLNITQRVLRMSALVLKVELTACPAEVVAAMTKLSGLEPTLWLAAGARDFPDNPYAARAVAAARVLTADPHRRSDAVVGFIACDARLPEIERMIAPSPEQDSRRTGQQLSLLSV